MTEMAFFFKELRRSNQIIYTNLISACASCGQWPGALSLLHSMSTIQVTPNVVTCTAALGAYVTSGYWHGALQLLRSMVGQVDGHGLRAISGSIDDSIIHPPQGLPRAGVASHIIYIIRRYISFGWRASSSKFWWSTKRIVNHCKYM